MYSCLLACLLVSAIESLGFFLGFKFSFDYDNSRLEERIELLFSRIIYKLG